MAYLRQPRHFAEEDGRAHFHAFKLTRPARARLLLARSLYEALEPVRRCRSCLDTASDRRDLN